MISTNITINPAPLNHPSADIGACRARIHTEMLNFENKTKRKMKALVIGATGAVGKDLLQMLLSDESVEQIDIFVRREVKIPSAKLAVHIVDFERRKLRPEEEQARI